MPELRWILAAIGVALIIGIYLWTRSRQRGDRGRTSRREPMLDDGDPWAGVADVRGETHERHHEMEAADDFALHEPLAPSPEAAAAEPEPSQPEQLIIALRLKARSSEGFEGADLKTAFAAERLEFGRFGAFHSLDEQGQTRFLVASLVEPGSFDPEAMPGQRCPGVSLFVVLPGPREPLTALDGMIASARRLARALDGEVLDEKGNALTVQEAAWLREQVVEYQRRMRVGAGTSPGRAGGHP
jgi:cell division protein ZipA